MSPTRRLAAILAADVVGYSRLMQADEAGALTSLKSRRKEILQPLIATHHGRIVKVMGDGVLVEFASAVDAVECAAALQEAMEAANAGLPEDRRIVLRIGINLGDVMVEGGDLYGDGVNIAARLEALADAGSVFISQTVFSHVKGKTNLGFEDLGERSLKNMAEPVRVYRLSGTATLPTGATVTGDLPSKPSIAVLPFMNLSGDPDQEYFSDGMTEDIITDLSRFHSLFVIARNSSFQYRDKAADVRRIARELGVRYVVEGSVRKSGDRLRITAQLIDAITGNHLWAERYDRDLTDLFAVQDEVVRAIVIRTAGHITTAEFERARRKRTEHLSAHDCFLRGLDLWRLTGPDAHAKFMSWLEKAVELDPQYAEPLTRLSISLAVETFYNEDPAKGFERAYAMANKAVSLEPGNSWSHCALGVVKLISGSVAASAEHFETAMRLNPNDSDQIVWCAVYHTYMGGFTEALNMITAAERLDPLAPPWYRVCKAMAEYGLRHYDSAACLLEGLGSDTNAWDHYYLAACYERLGRVHAASAEVAKARKMKTSLSIEAVALWDPYTKPEDLEHLLEPLRRLGLPER